MEVLNIINTRSVCSIPQLKPWALKTLMLSIIHFSMNMGMDIWSLANIIILHTVYIRENIGLK